MRTETGRVRNRLWEQGGGRATEPGTPGVPRAMAQTPPPPQVASSTRVHSWWLPMSLPTIPPPPPAAPGPEFGATGLT